MRHILAIQHYLCYILQNEKYAGDSRLQKYYATEKLCEVYMFDSLGAFLYFDFFRGLNQGYISKRCDNCGRYFLLEAGKYSNY